MQKSNFHTRLKELRTEQKLSQQEFGLAIGLSKQAINGMEAGRRTTTIEKLIDIAEYFNVTSDYLLGLSENKYEVAEKAFEITKDAELLLKNFSFLDDISKGKLIERSRILLEESVNQKNSDDKLHA